MLVALGFLCAMLITFMLVPAYRRRIVRLTSDELRRTMPLTEDEIRAGRDRLRAKYAVIIHDLESRMERLSLAASRRIIEINRRDAAISALEGEIERLKEIIEEHENARRVLEHTVTHRLPQVEQRLAEAKQLLEQRDGEIAELTRSSSEQARALDQANQINAQQRASLLRTSTALSVRKASPGGLSSQTGAEREAALLAELEMLRAKTRDQAMLIGRLQKLAAHAQDQREETHPASGASGTGAPAGISRLHLDLAEAEATLKAVHELPAGTEPASKAEVTALKTKIEDQTAEIARLTAALAAWENSDKAGNGGKESKLALKARLRALEAHGEEQAKMIRALRAEAAAANERLARQAAHFREELRRVGGSSRAAAFIHAGETADKAGAPQTHGVTRKTLQERLAEHSAGLTDGPLKPPPAEEDRTAGTAPGGQAVEAAAKEETTAPGAATGPEERETQARKPRLLERISNPGKPPA